MRITGCVYFWKQEKQLAVGIYVIIFLAFVKLFTGKYEQKANHQLLILRLDLEGEWANGFGDRIVSGLVQQRLTDVFFFKPNNQTEQIFLATKSWD